jgi:hypothetical protein
MRSIFRKFIVWVMTADKSKQAEAVPVTLGSEEHVGRAQPKFRLGLIAAANGRILEMSTYKHNPHGPDWTSELFIVPEDQTLSQSITTILTIKGIDT